MASLKVVPKEPNSETQPKRKGEYRPGDVIAGKYRLVQELGEGGMGVVWIGHNTVLDVPVAVKLMSIGTETDTMLRERLLQEARASARIAHAAICRTLDYGTTDRGAPFVVMELLRGETLANGMGPSVRIPATRAVQMLLPIINGLGVAHALGIVHRDVKPENVFLSRDEFGRMQPKLLDFGIARFVKFESKLTLEGAALGTPDYMSPEQARGDVDVDFRTDVWSVCVVLYEMIAGKVPFVAENYNKLMWAIQNEQPVPTVELAAADEALWTVLKRGLAKDRLDRWASMHELGEALALWLFERGIKEDVCGASLRSTWLEAGLSGVKVEVSSVAPPPNPESLSKLTLSPSQVRKRAAALEAKAPEPAAVDALLAQTQSGDRPSDVDDTAKTGQYQPKRTGRPVLALLVVICLAGAGFGVVRYVVAPRLAPTPSTTVAMPAPTPTETVAEKAVEPEPPPAPLPSATEAAVSADSLPAEPPPAVSVHPKAVAAAAAPKARPRPPPAKPAAGKTKQPKAVDFGF